MAFSPSIVQLTACKSNEGFSTATRSDDSRLAISAHFQIETDRTSGPIHAGFLMLLTSHAVLGGRQYKFDALAAKAARRDLVSGSVMQFDRPERRDRRRTDLVWNSRAGCQYRQDHSRIESRVVDRASQLNIHCRVGLRSPRPAVSLSMNARTLLRPQCC